MGSKKFVRCKKCQMDNCPDRDITKNRIFCMLYTKTYKDWNKETNAMGVRWKDLFKNNYKKK